MELAREQTPCADDGASMTGLFLDTVQFDMAKVGQHVA
jgi:hypothetical protein